MTFKITKSLLKAAKIDPEKFGADVALFAAEINSHKEHMARVERDAKLPELIEPNFNDFDGSAEKFTHACHAHAEEKMKRHMPYPPPYVPYPFNEAIANGVPDFEIVNDDEIVAQIEFDERKRALLTDVSQAEATLIEALKPAEGKRRADDIRENRIRGALTKDIMALSLSKPTAEFPDLDRDARSRLPDDDRKFLEDRERITATTALIQEWAAQLLSGIEDLTPQTIGDWKITPFNGAQP